MKQIKIILIVLVILLFGTVYMCTKAVNTLLKPENIEEMSKELKDIKEAWNEGQE